MKLYPDDTLVFFGDSITEWGRDKEDLLSLGHGYVQAVAGHLAASYPQAHLDFYNQGIGGNRVSDLNDRLEDCLALKPSAMILLVGINDVWHNVGKSSFGTPAEQTRFEKEYRKLLSSIKEAGVERILVLEPFVLNDPEDRKTWRQDLDPKIQIIRQFVQEFGLELVPLDGLLNEQAIRYSAAYYTGEDGVHPTLAGAHFIAQEVLKRLEVEG